MRQHAVECQRCKQHYGVQDALDVPVRLVGKVIDRRFVLRHLLTEGGFSRVFHAEELVLGQSPRPVAVKLIYPDPELSRDLQAKELVATLKLSHPGVIQGIGAGTCMLEGTLWLYLVMELAEESLDTRMRRALLSPTEAWLLAEQVGAALAYLHRDPNRLVHRDMKPDNLLRVGGQWKLADFGLIQGMERARDLTNLPAGTERYMPPEGFEGGVISPAWDMWGFGVLLAEALTGAHPFAGDRHLLFAITQLEPHLPTDLPLPFGEIIRGCLIKKRSQRWTALRVLDALHAARGLRASLSAWRWALGQRLRAPKAPVQS